MIGVLAVVLTIAGMFLGARLGFRHGRRRRDR